MKIILFLVTFLISSLTSNCYDFNLSSQATHQKSEQLKTDVNLATNQYYNFPEVDGNFFAWKAAASDSDTPNNNPIVGINTTENRSYLVAKDGLMVQLNFIVSYLLPISNDFAMVKIASYQDENQQLHTNELVFVNLSGYSLTINHNLVFNRQPINNTYALVNQKEINNSANHEGLVITASGLGLETITITNKQKVEVETYINPPNSNEPQSNLSFFYPNPETPQGVYVGNDDNFYDISDITKKVSPQKFASGASRVTDNNVVFISKTTAVFRTAVDYIRNDQNNLWVQHFDKGTLNGTVVNLRQISYVNQFCQVIDNTNVLFLISNVIKTDTHDGTPMVTTVKDLENNNECYLTLIKQHLKINQIVRIEQSKKNDTEVILTNQYNETGLYQFTCKDLVNELVLITNYGNINQVIELADNLGIASNQGQQCLFNFYQSDVLNSWAIHNQMTLTPSGYNSQVNFVNFQSSLTAIPTDNNYQNMYVTNKSMRLDLTNDKLKEIVIKNQTTIVTTLTPNLNHQFSYTFNMVGKFQAEFYQQDNQIITYQFLVKPFTNTGLKLNTTVPINQYVGTVDQQLYDVNAINSNSDSNNSFTLNPGNPDEINTIDLVTTHTNHLVVIDVHPIVFNQTVQYQSDQPLSDHVFYSLKITNLLGQVNWIYLGFIINQKLPIPNFWDTVNGQELANQAVQNGYQRIRLYTMDSKQIKVLMQDAQNWKLITYSGNAFAITMAVYFVLAFIFIGVAATYYYRIVIAKTKNKN